MLGDVDRQQSSRTWLGVAPRGPADDRDLGSQRTATSSRPPKGTTHVVLDTPAGLHGKRLDEVMKLADKVLVPLQPSIFDIHATHDFLDQLLAHRRSDKVQIGRGRHAGRARARSPTDQLRSSSTTLGVPVLGFLRDTQNYVHLAARGLTLWDVAPGARPARPRAVGADHRAG